MLEAAVGVSKPLSIQETTAVEKRARAALAKPIVFAFQ